MWVCAVASSGALCASRCVRAPVRLRALSETGDVHEAGPGPVSQISLMLIVGCRNRALEPT